MKQNQRENCKHITMVMWTSFFCLFTVSCLEIDNQPETGEEDNVTLVKQTLENGIVTLARPEVGQFHSWSGNCTATLIHPQYVLTAAHCNYGLPVVVNNTTFSIGGTSYPVDRIWTFGSEGPLFAPTPPDSGTVMGTELFSEDSNGGHYNIDLMLARLSKSVPGGQAMPATISDVTPVTLDPVSTFGYGRYGLNCGSAADGNKRFTNWMFDPMWDETCPGDSGGPFFMGQDNLLGPIWGVTSFREVHANVVRYKEEIFAAIQAMENTRWVTNTDRPGSTYSTRYNIASVANCEHECITDTKCRAWTYRSSNRRCYLKDKAMTWVPSSGRTSGLRPRFEFNVDRPGSDFFNFNIPAPPGGDLEVAAAVCAGACGRDSRCFSYTYYHDHCWLKTSIPAASTLNDAISGVKRATEPITDRIGADYSWFSSSANDCAQSCATESRCLSYSHADGTCYLKEYVPWPASTPGVTSGMKRPVELPGIILHGPLIPGSEDFPLDTPHPEACRSLCNAEPLCIAYVYRQPLIGLQARCSLIEDRIDDITAEWTYSSGMSGLTFF